MLSKRRFVMGAATLSVSACSSLSNQPVADSVLVSKSARSMSLYRGQEALRTYRVDLGFAPNGTKHQEGDGRTPEGRYFIDRKNPRSAFYLSLGINYPNQNDLARAEAAGVDPGGDIFIHGGPRKGLDRDIPDWTAGCIAVTNGEIEEIYAMVRLGTPITILA